MKRKNNLTPVCQLGETKTLITTNNKTKKAKKQTKKITFHVIAARERKQIRKKKQKGKWSRSGHQKKIGKRKKRLGGAGGYPARAKNGQAKG